MSSETCVSTNAFPCPNCGKYDSVDVGPDIPTHSVEYCAHCKNPYVVQNVTRIVTTVHRIEGIEPPCPHEEDEEERMLCTECGLLYKKEDWCFSYHTCNRCAEHLDFEGEQKESEFKLIPGSKNARYRCEDGHIELTYLGYSHTKIDLSALWEIADGPEEKQKEMIVNLLGDQATKNRITSMNCFVNALRAGDIQEIQEDDE